jgi:hypothetical protein
MRLEGSAVVPGGLDLQAARVAIACSCDRALRLWLAGGILGRDSRKSVSVQIPPQGLDVPHHGVRAVVSKSQDRPVQAVPGAQNRRHSTQTGVICRLPAGWDHRVATSLSQPKIGQGGPKTGKTGGPMKVTKNGLQRSHPADEATVFEIPAAPEAVLVQAHPADEATVNASFDSAMSTVTRMTASTTPPTLRRPGRRHGAQWTVP